MNLLNKFIVLVALLFFAILYLKLAEYFNIIDKPNQRSSHTVPTIRGGGVLFLIAVWFFFIGSDFQYPYMVFGVTLIGGISFIDDLKTLSAKLRLPFQVVSVLLILFQVGVFQLDLWVVLLVFVLCLGFMNFYNFMDGINGITGMYSLSVLIGMYLINKNELIIGEDLFIYLMFSILIFGYFNFRKKARFFAGDIGSITISLVLFFIGAKLAIDLGSPLISLMGMVYGADAALTLIYRKKIGEHITEPHRHHIYQKLVDVSKFSHIYVSLGYALIQMLVNVIVVKNYNQSISMQYFILLCTVLFFIVLYIVLFEVIQTKKRKFES